MNHFYEMIPGMFNFQEVYRLMVDEADTFAHFVEVGAFKGKSAAFMAVEIANSGKDIIFDVVDTFEGSVTVPEEHQSRNPRTKDYYSYFLENVKPGIEYIRPFPLGSVEASKRYDNQSLDFVFIDADHRYENVKADIQAWHPKVKNHGFIGGHDYRSNCPGVWKAVREHFSPTLIKRIGTSWMVRV